MDPLFLDWAFKGLLTGIFVYAVKVLTELKSSIESLKIKMAVIVEQVSAHDKRITKLEGEK